MPQPIVISTSKAFPGLEDLGLLGGSVDALSAMAWTATGMIRIRCRNCSAPTGLPHRLRSPERRRLPLPPGSRAASVWGGGGAKRRDQVVVPVVGDAGLEIASLSTKKGPRSCENCSDWH